ncbi:MAG: hypothetical protein FWG26_07340 [Betaproteobacteria bacterium]|nr:hypothetical protein [Betaproteobacteria bacterium]
MRRTPPLELPLEPAHFDINPLKSHWRATGGRLFAIGQKMACPGISTITTVTLGGDFSRGCFYETALAGTASS